MATIVLAERIREKRMELGLTQSELADRMGMHRSSILRIERGEIDLDQSRISQFCRVLGTTPGWLMGWEVEPEKAGATAAKVLKSAEVYQMVQDYFSLEESDKSIVRALIASLKAKKD